MRARPLEELLSKVSPRYALVNVVAARARQLIAKDLPAVETATRNPVLIAMEELAYGRLRVEQRRTAVPSAPSLPPNSEADLVEPAPIT